MATSVNSLISANQYWIDRLNPWLVHFGNGFGVRWYGLAYLAGFLLAGWILARWARSGKLPIPETDVASFILYAALGVMIGGRLGYCLLYNLHEVAHRPLEILEVWHGGMASHGGMAGLIVAVWFFARRRDLNTLSLLGNGRNRAARHRLGPHREFCEWRTVGQTNSCPLGGRFP
jgi:phosphatidylglycerol---prolipoprotein diacylglyceryl transferase